MFPFICASNWNLFSQTKSYQIWISIHSETFVSNFSIDLIVEEAIAETNEDVDDQNDEEQPEPLSLLPHEQIRRNWSLSPSPDRTDGENIIGCISPPASHEDSIREEELTDEFQAEEERVSALF